MTHIKRIIMKKYKIKECLERLNIIEYRIALKDLPKLIGKSRNTLFNYLDMEIGSDQDIPYTVVIRLEHFFGLQPGALINEHVRLVSLKELLEGHKGES